MKHIHNFGDFKLNEADATVPVELKARFVSEPLDLAACCKTEYPAKQPVLIMTHDEKKVLGALKLVRSTSNVLVVDAPTAEVSDYLLTKAKNFEEQGALDQKLRNFLSHQVILVNGADRATEPLLEAFLKLSEMFKIDPAKAEMDVLPQIVFTAQTVSESDRFREIQRKSLIVGYFPSK
jgi:hypothetical protein